jgi:hypothetical protein
LRTIVLAGSISPRTDLQRTKSEAEGIPLVEVVKLIQHHPHKTVPVRIGYGKRNYSKRRLMSNRVKAGRSPNYPVAEE